VSDARAGIAPMRKPTPGGWVDWVARSVTYGFFSNLSDAELMQ
jgi:hypothetical protein